MLFGTIIHEDPDAGIVTIRPADGSHNLLARIPLSMSYPLMGAQVSYTLTRTGHQQTATIQAVPY